MSLKFFVASWNSARHFVEKFSLELSLRFSIEAFREKRNSPELEGFPEAVCTLQGKREHVEVSPARLSQFSLRRREGRLVF